jgi:hypothetical protein
MGRLEVSLPQCRFAYSRKVKRVEPEARREPDKQYRFKLGVYPVLICVASVLPLKFSAVFNRCVEQYSLLTSNTGATPTVVPRKCTVVFQPDSA